MTTTLGSATEVRRILGRTSADLSDADAEAFLNQAIRKIQARYFTKWMRDKFYATVVNETGATNKVYSTYFKMKDSASDVSVYVNGVILTVTTDYTISASASTITISSSFSLTPTDVINVYYLPEFYDDLANYMAAQLIFQQGMIDLQSGTVAAAIYQNIKDTVKEYEDMILRKPTIAKFRDHIEHEGIW